MNRRTKALSIPPEVKDQVWDRDGGCCVWCGAYNALPNAHYIPRSRSGFGTEQNILTLCFKCHRTFDQPGTDAEIATARRMKAYFKHYLRSKYPGWNEKNLVYKKE